MVTIATIRAMRRRAAQTRHCRGWARNSLYAALEQAGRDMDRLLDELEKQRHGH